MSWDQNTAATMRPSAINLAVWLPCNRFIAITWDGAATVDVLDSVTLQRLQTFESPQGISAKHRVLVFSPDSRILTSFGDAYAGGLDRELFVSSWDLQTGGLASIIRWQGPIIRREGLVIRWQGPREYVAGNPSITYSANGTMVGVFCQYSGRTDTDIIIRDVASGMYMHSHSLNHYIPLSRDIWNHGESLRFATVDKKTTTIWEIGFARDATPTEVETLPAPERFSLQMIGEVINAVTEI